ncbi:MAG: YraN family protein [Lachnospiraceae bacterium]
MNKRKTGAVYEEKAAAYLKEKGYRILEKNYRCPLGEIDLIAEESGYLVFIEVKYRRTSRLGTGEEAVNTKKQRRILGAARWYLMEHGMHLCRFDVAAINGTEITLIRNAFECR